MEFHARIEVLIPDSLSFLAYTLVITQFGLGKNHFHTNLGDIMNKSEMIDAIATRSELSKAVATKALDAVIETIVDAVAKGDTVTLVGFGSFKASTRAAREGKNPKTGEKIQIPEMTIPKFAAGATFKTRVAEQGE